MRNTSTEAAVSIQPIAHNMRMAVLAEIKRGRGRGRTCDEIETALDMRHQTASARVHELNTSAAIKDSGRRRPTRSGRNAIVWVVA